jgi:hypothetical protein
MYGVTLAKRQFYSIDLSTSPFTITSLDELSRFCPASAQYTDAEGNVEPTGLGISEASWDGDYFLIGWAFTDWSNPGPKGAPMFVYDRATKSVVWTYTQYVTAEYDKPNGSMDCRYISPGAVSILNQPAPTSDAMLGTNPQMQWNFVDTPTCSEQAGVGQHGALGHKIKVNFQGYINPENFNGGGLLLRSLSDVHRIWTVGATDRAFTPFPTTALYAGLTGRDQTKCLLTTVSDGYIAPMDGELILWATDGSNDCWRICHHYGNLSGNYAGRGLGNFLNNNQGVVFSSNWLGSAQDPTGTARTDVFFVPTPGFAIGDVPFVPPIDMPAYADQQPIRLNGVGSSYQQLTAVTIPAAMLVPGTNTIQICVDGAPYGYGPQPLALLVESAISGLTSPGQWQYQQCATASPQPFSQMPPVTGIPLPVVACTPVGSFVQPTAGSSWVSNYSNCQGPTGQGQNLGLVFSCRFTVTGEPQDISINVAANSLPTRFAVNGYTLRNASAVATNPQFQLLPMTMGCAGPDVNWPLPPTPPVVVPLGSLTVSPGTLTGGRTATATVFIYENAPSGGAIIAISASLAPGGTGVIPMTIPASLTMPAGANQASFAVPTMTVSTPVVVELTATSGTASVRGYIFVLPPVA